MSAIDSLVLFHETTALNSGLYPQEIIYLHIDNTSYYQGDRIYFACYLMTADRLKASNLSQTVYVELLNPAGKVIDKCVLKAVNGRCHGSLSVNETPFYSGYYEIRAFTRYMLNFGDEAIFTRVIPVFNKPKTEGDFAERSMLKYGSRERTYLRPKPISHDKVEAKFYPEGGHLVSSIPSRVGVEITDANLRPIITSGRVIDQNTDSVVATFTTGAAGRGSFDFIPGSGKYSVEFDFQGKTQTFNLPKAENSGIALAVDNLSNSDSVKITVSRTPDLPPTLIGASLTCRGRLYSRAIIDLSEDLSASFITSREKLPTGVIQLTLFNTEGTPIADRLFFNNRNDFVTYDYEFDKSSYNPYEPVNLTLNLSNPTAVSLSVTDADNQVAYYSDILADLLLASEVKGYIHNPAYYFADPSDPERQRELDNMLMIQGWRKYPWRQLAGLEPFNLDLNPEKGIEVHGRVLSRYTDKPQKDVSISALITNLTEDSTKRKVLFLDSFDTDVNGNFAFRTDIEGNAMMTLSPVKKKSIKSYRILLNTDRYPEMRGYDRAEMVTEIDTTFHAVATAANYPDTAITYIDDLPDDSTRHLSEVVVKARASHWTRANIISNASVRHDIDSEYNNMLDHGAKNIRSLIDILLSIDKKFSQHKEILYDARNPLFIVEGGKFMENEQLMLVGQDENFITAKQLQDLDINTRFNYIGNAKIFGNCNPHLIPVEYIKNVYINTKDDAIFHYISEYYPDCSHEEMDRIKRRVGCVVLIELNPMMPAQLKKGMRRSVLEGYTTNMVEFYSPDYSGAPPVEPDYRRTLYWNPDLLPDADGNIRINFFNNSFTRHPRVSAAYLPYPAD
ncbi:MAG: hypothetical protein K2M05_07760 [Paramuribaculum sp.]|nr:hypothetical protein [Paramuribaculum sp.]